MGLAIEVCLTFWGVVGGQYDLELMFWPWKFGLTLVAAALSTAITAELIRGVPEQRGAFSRRTVIYGALLVAMVIAAGFVSYHYYLNEPDDSDDAPASQTTRLYRQSPAPWVVRRHNRRLAGIPAYSEPHRWRDRD